MYLHTKHIITAGTAIEEAKRAIIMLHGRGASAQDIISLKARLHLPDTAIFAPQATNNSWYPYSFLAPLDSNQPALDSALSLIDELVEDILSKGVALDKLYFLGFSQGACLSLEYTARNASEFGGIMAFTGGLIGEKLEKSKYQGDFKQTPILITTGDPDPHVPVTRVRQSVAILEELDAAVTLKIYPGRMHTIQTQEIELANQLVLK